MLNYSNNASYSNSTLESSTGFDTTSARVIKGISFFILFWFSIFGNVLVVVLVYLRKELHSTINYLIANMAVSDLLFSLLTIPDDFVGIIVGPPYRWTLEGGVGNIICKFNKFIVDVTLTVSIFSMVIIASERFRAAVFPLKQALIRTKRIVAVIATVWIASGLLNSPNLYRFKLYTSPVTGTLVCNSKWDDPIDSHQADTIIWCILFAITGASTFFMSVLYLKIFLALKKRPSFVGRCKGCRNCRMNRLRKQTSRRVNGALFFVAIVFFVTWAPILTYVTLASFNTVPWDKDIVFWLLFLARTYQAINPCGYFLCNKAYQKALLEIVRCKSRKRSSCNNFVFNKNTRGRRTCGKNTYELKEMKNLK